MKKNSIIAIVIGILVLGTVFGFATDMPEKIAQHLQNSTVQKEGRGAQEARDNQERKAKIEKYKNKENKWDKASKFEQMLYALDATLENAVDYNNVVYNYEYLKQAYHLSEEQLDVISDMIIKGYDAMDIMDICYFWLDTNEDIRIIEDIYLRKGHATGLNWIEQAFNDVTDDKCGVLTTEDVNAYVADGISVTDIMLANKLCRKGTMTIQEILERRKGGVPFAEIAASVHGEDVDELPAKARTQNRAQGKPAQDMISARAIEHTERLARMEKKPRKEYYQKELDGESVEELLKRTEDQLEETINAHLREKGIYKTVSEEDKAEYLSREGFDESK